ncbi:hypothetical protein M422DRAFT_25293 [Sphaerobolus stellatus SS14]|uniref:Uncharacterized protein n=1 Tax=Sphaerobolus stellatus (strain SS14) TaxID=990650 RepID=A0A0C9UII1_SPHS4|nr:hypothetical protein M422DRAFT_38899 [Sphaerobolus stellatus SS14]KIJ54375.1 hypothetical protein M422DRAFT_25293 [Sphaerobolus stellatus SS14]
MAIGEDTAFSPVDEDGKPLRKFSERHEHEWTRSVARDMVEAMKDVSINSDHDNADSDE